MKQWKHIISAGEAGLPLGRILKAAGFTKNEISRQKFIPDGITLDGEKCRVTQQAAEGQILALNLEEAGGESRETSRDEKLSGDSLEILYEDESLLIVTKPSGMSCHPGRGHYQDNLGCLAVDHCCRNGEKITIRQIGRLDKDTSGIVVFGKSKIAAARLWKQRKDGSFKKTYKAWVHGRMEASEGIINFPIAPVTGEKNKMCAVFPEDAQKDTKQLDIRAMYAVTHYRVIGEKTTPDGIITCVECRLETGRTHQIRVHMSAIGHPLLGDCVYGIPDRAERLCLHAESVSLFHPFTGEKIVLYAENCFGIFLS